MSTSAFDPTNKSLEIELNGKILTIFFTGNTFMAFQKRTGKFFLNWYFEVMKRTERFLTENAEINRDMSPEQVIEALSKRSVSPFEMLDIAPMEELVSLIWSGCYELRGGEITRPYTIAEIGEWLDLDNYPALFHQVLNAASENLPRRKAAATTVEEPTPRPTNHSPAKRPRSGGRMSGPSDDEILASQIRR